MQDKELEKILQEKADNTKIRDFSEVWNEIKDEITPKEKEKESVWKKKFFQIFVPALLVVCIAFSPLIVKLFNPLEEVFYNDELIMKTVTEDEALERLFVANIAHIDMSKYVSTEAFLHCTEEGVVKGARFTFYNKNDLTFFATMDLYDKSVDLRVNQELYDTNCQVNSADVYYKFKSASSSFYVYSVYASYKGVKYLIEYSGVSDNLMEFLADFFA